MVQQMMLCVVWGGATQVGMAGNWEVAPPKIMQNIIC